MAKKRFIKIHSDGTLGGGASIIVDSETGVNYLYLERGYGGGLTPLLDANGKVVVTPVAPGSAAWNTPDDLSSPER